MNLPPFERLLDEHGPVVRRVCRALLGPAEADDAWSETFLAALEAYPGLENDRNLRGWLVTIAHRKSVDQIRRAARSTPSDQVSGPSATDRYPSDDDDLWQALSVLPDKQRRAVIYHHVAGLPYAEVGRILGSSTDAARRSAADGIAALRRAHPSKEEQ